ncbi:phosphatidylglycerol lysyltransferase domain-containing protein [Streptomyces sp. NPDC058459]|uniref:phosphatidylglycerol lysyltransferase domain-containing protein n=1 Tax=Streptomyces sp. NPDC058459 TaxID=3346508 RepID=UPI0036506767
MSAPAEAQAVLDVLREHADHPSAFLAVNSATHHYRSDLVPGIVAHLPGRRHHIQFAGPFAPPSARDALLDDYLRHLGPGTTLTAVQLRRDELPLYVRRGFTANQIGSSYAIDLSRFTLRGKPLAKIRQNVSRARREGVTVVEAAPDDLAGRQSLDDIDRAWLRAKGRHVKELSFLVGERGGPGRTSRRTFLARRHGSTVAYITYSPVWGSRPGWLYDLTRRSPPAPVGTIELINLTALTAFADEGAQWLHLGLTPFAGLDRSLEPASSSPLLTRALRQVARRGTALYPARTQEAFKLKWAPQVIEPEYVAFQDRVRPGAVWRLLRAISAV